MNKLLKAEFYRLKKDKVFLLLIIITCVLALFTLYKYFDNSGIITLDRIMTEYLYMYFGIFIAFFVSMYVGKEYTEGFIRNKIVVGHKRRNIYLSNLIICIAVGLIVNIIYIGIVFLVGTKIFGELQKLNLFQIIAYTSLIIVAYCTIYNFITMLCKDASVSLVTCVIIFIIMFVAMMFVSTKLMEKPYIKITQYNEKGEIEFSDKEINPNYPGETTIKMYKVINYLLPTGQAEMLQNACAETIEPDEYEINQIKQDLRKMPFYAISEIVLLNILGILIFKSQELK